MPASRSENFGFDTFYALAMLAVSGRASEAGKVCIDIPAPTGRGFFAALMIQSTKLAFLCTKLVFLSSVLCFPIPRRFNPFLEGLDREEKKLRLRIADGVLGSFSSAFAPEPLRYELPKMLLTQEFAAYAQKLGLPNITDAIRAGLKNLPPEPRRALAP